MQRRYYVYVIALEPEVAMIRKFAARNPDYDQGKPCLYVGSTAVPPEKRFEQHLNGYRSNSFVQQFGLELMPSLFDRYNPIESRYEAELTERHIGDRLRRKGYGVWYG